MAEPGLTFPGAGSRRRAASPTRWLALLRARTVRARHPGQAADQTRRERELAFLLDAAQRLASSLDPNVILQRAVELTATGISRAGASRGPRAAYHRLEGDALRVHVAQDDDGESGEGFEYPLMRDQGAVGALRSGKPAIVRPDHMAGTLREHVEALSLRVLLTAPVRSGKDVHGFLVATARDGPAVGSHQLGLLEMLAHITGLALVNAEHLQREREHAERIESLEKMKSELLNLVSHELRGPLTVALGYVSMLEDGSLGSLTPESRSVLPIVTAKLNEMEGLVEQMLEASRMEESALILDRGRIDLRDIAREAVEMLLPLADERHTVKLEMPNQRVPVLADRNRVSTIVANLLTNAVKYSPQGGEVRCTVSVDGRMASLSVADQGLGISESDLPRLFTRFGRILTPENRAIAGTGLGLHLSRQLARQHGGDIQATSQVGVGSTFTLTLPVA